MKFDKNLAALHGYLCGDGYVCRNLPHQKHIYYNVGLRNQNIVLLEDFRKKFFKVFGVNPKIVPGERCIKYSKEIYYRLMENGPYHSYTWKYPELSEENSRYWLRAFFDCEGWVQAKARKTRRIGLESVNGEQLMKVILALKKCGIKSTFYKRDNRKIFGLLIDDKRSLIRFRNKVGFLHPDKRQKLDEAIASFVDYKWDFSKKSLESLIRSKLTFKRPHTIRAFSKLRSNLEKLSKVLNNRFGIHSKIQRATNGLGTVYYCLSIYKKQEIKKLIDRGLLGFKIIKELTKVL